jgi:hypothetical protein
MIVEPRAADSLTENMNPVGRVYYGFSTMICTPSSLNQEVGLPLGAQAGERRPEKGDLEGWIYGAGELTVRAGRRCRTD